MNSLGGHAASIPLQNSGVSHAVLPEGRQRVREAIRTSGGQLPLVPVHCSATSQVAPATSDTAGRHVVPALAKPAGGQALSVPLHTASRSQRFRPREQTSPALCLRSGGHVGPPAQRSSTSQGPLDGPQTLEAGANTLVGHTVLLPVQYSGRSQTPPDTRHNVDDGAGMPGEHTPVMQFRLPRSQGL